MNMVSESSPKLVAYSQWYFRRQIFKPYVVTLENVEHTINYIKINKNM